MRAPLLEHLPGTRVTDPPLLGGWSAHRIAPNRPKTRFYRHPAKGDGFRRIEVPSTALEPTRMGRDPNALLSAHGGLLLRARSDRSPLTPPLTSP